MSPLSIIDVENVQIATYNKNFVLEDKKFHVDIPASEAVNIIKNALISVLNNNSQNADVSNIISAIKSTKPYITVAIDDKIKEIYLYPVVNGDAKIFIKRELTNAINSKASVKKVQTVKVKLPQSDALQKHSQKAKDVLRKKIISDIDLEKAVFMSGLLCSHGKILIHPRECTEKSRFKDTMFEIRGPGKPNKTTAELIFPPQTTNLTIDEIRDGLSLLTSITSEDPNVHNGIGGVFLSFFTECSDLCESMGIGKEFIKSLKDVEQFERDREEQYLDDKFEIRTLQNQKDEMLNKLDVLVKKHSQNAEVLEKESQAIFAEVEKIKLPKHPKVKSFVFEFSSFEKDIKESVTNLSNYPYLISSSSTKEKLEAVFELGKKDNKQA